MGSSHVGSTWPFSLHPLWGRKHPKKVLMYSPRGEQLTRLFPQHFAPEMKHKNDCFFTLFLCRGERRLLDL